IEHFVVALQRKVEFLKVSAKDIRAKDDFLKGAGTARGCVRTHHPRPPEDRTEEAVIILLLDQRGAGKVKKEIWIPSSNFACFGIIRISQMSANDGQPRPVPCNQIKPRHP